jgi:predicted nucleic acid-binding protein
MDTLPTLAETLTEVSLEGLMAEAISLSLTTGASAYDCLYVVLTDHRNCQLVTAERRPIAENGTDALRTVAHPARLD